MLSSRHTRFGLFALASMLAVTAIEPSDVDAGIVVISRGSTLTVDGAGKGTPFSDTASSTGSGNFDDGVFGQEGDAPDGTYARGSASQNSTVTFGPGGGPFGGSGFMFADAFAQFGDDTSSDNHVSADSLLTVVFQVTDSNEPFSVSGEFQIVDIFGDSASFRLAETSEPPDGSGPITFFAGNDADLASETTFSGLLSLRPATYTVTVQAGSGSSGTGPGGIEPFGYETGLTSFAFTVGQTVEPPPPTVIPLPAGVWAGMLGLTAAAGAARKSGRLRGR